jgi:hypothetical protein
MIQIDSGLLLQLNIVNILITLSFKKRNNHANKISIFAAMAKQKKHTLTFEQTFDFDMVGICSHHSDYRLAWGINQCLTIHLCRCEEDYIVTNKKGEAVSSHSMYEFADEENRLDYFLVKNKMHGNYLIPEKPSIDFFLFLCDNIAIDIEQLTKQLKEVSSILGVYPFEPEEINSAEYLVFR